MTDYTSPHHQCKCEIGCHELWSSYFAKVEKSDLLPFQNILEGIKYEIHELVRQIDTVNHRVRVVGWIGLVFVVVLLCWGVWTLRGSSKGWRHNDGVGEGEGNDRVGEGKGNTDTDIGGQGSGTKRSVVTGETPDSEDEDEVDYEEEWRIQSGEY